MLPGRFQELSDEGGAEGWPVVAPIQRQQELSPTRDIGTPGVSSSRAICLGNPVESGFFPDFQANGTGIQVKKTMRFPKLGHLLITRCGEICPFG